MLVLGPDIFSGQCRCSRRWLRDGGAGSGGRGPSLWRIALFLWAISAGDLDVSYLVPPSLTIWQAAAAPASQIFMLLGTTFLLPIILGYYVFIYWLFHGKVREGEGYH